MATGGGEHGAGRLRAPGEQIRRLPHAALEQLAHDAKAKRPVELGAAPTHDPQAGGLGDGAGEPHQRGLADPGVPLDQDCSPVSPGCLLNGLPE